MSEQKWNETFLHSSADIIDPSADRLWELFHENSKTGQNQSFMSNEQILDHMNQISESFNYQNYPTIDLPSQPITLSKPTSGAMLERQSARSMQATEISLEQLHALLHYAYGITRETDQSEYPRSFRTAPSGGALYPLEIYCYASKVSSLQHGIYHFNSTKNHLRRVIDGDLTSRLSKSLVQNNLAFDASILIFITGVFERTIFKYGNRGYRFVLFEAGHVAQNMNLVASALDLGCLNIGGFFDRQIDQILGIDGINHSTLYMLAIGGKD